LGVGPGAVFRRVVLPLLARPAAAGMVLVFLTTMKELPATLLLRPTGFETLVRLMGPHPELEAGTSVRLEVIGAARILLQGEGARRLPKLPPGLFHVPGGA